MSFQERLRKILENKGISSYRVSKDLKISQGSMTNYLNGNTMPNASIMKQLCEYLNTTEGWLLDGVVLDNAVVSEPEIKYENKDKYGTGIPLIPFDGMAGWLSVDNPGVNLSECEQYNVPEFANKGADYIIRVSGSSMYPKYSNGDLLACKKIVDIIFFQWGKVYVLDTSQGVLVKRIFEDKNSVDNIILMSDNKDHYPAFTIPKSDIRSLSIVLGVIRME